MTTSPTTSGALYLLDGNSLVFRAFFALPTDLATTAGQVTNAVHGFTSMVVMLLRDQSPSGMAVAFDRPEPTFRDEVVADYKGNRPETPDLLVPQFALVRQVLGAMGIEILEVPGFEADDVLATLATQGRDAGRDVVVVTGDRDCFQLVEDPHVKVMYTRRGISDT
ncbi:MAG TPA: DNA polymerase I, partial [Acidimicrobiales bacterium]|nr:DNA polymerase I [Acidimicrobiales bacterium]